jgi:hypothetical protein
MPASSTQEGRSAWPAQALTVTIYGIDSYTEEDLHTIPDEILSRRPDVVACFRVTSK